MDPAVQSVADLTPLVLNGIVVKAGAEIMRIYDTPFGVEAKRDESPVTEADRAAEAIILQGLERIAPRVPVVAEEEASAGRVPETAERFFLVDPLDGTREFISRNGEFTVNVALIENGEPVMGIVYAPALGEIFWGSAGKGAYRAKVRDGVIGDQSRIGVRVAPTEGLIAIGSRSHGSAETEAFLTKYKIANFIAAGSSLKFCRVAAGEADLYPRHGRTMEWDTAAGDAILRAAGGRVETLDGEPLSYGKRNRADEADFANPYFVAFGDAERL